MTAPPHDETLAATRIEEHCGRVESVPMWHLRILAKASVLAGFAGMAASIPGSPVVQSVLLLIVLTFGAGSAILCWVEIPATAACAGVIGLSLAAVVIGTTALARWDFWYPTASCMILSTGLACCGFLRLWNLRGRPGSLSIRWRRTLDRSALVPTVLLALALGTWLFALPELERGGSGQYGLLGTAGGFVLMMAMVATVSAFVVAMIGGRRIIAALAVLVTIFVGRLTASLITDVPIYGYTYKHIGVVDHLIENGALAPYWTDVYVRWPGFFTTMAWFSSITGLDPVDAAHWFAPVADILIAIVVGALALVCTRSADAALVAALLVQLVNWVGQDYYSPQAISLIMAFSILTLLLCAGKGSTAAALFSLLIFAAMVVTHQLTPVWVCGVVVALALFRIVRPRWLPIAYVVIWAIYVVPRLDSVMRYGLVNFDPIANTAGATAGVRTESAGYRLTVLVDRGLTVALWLLAASCVIILWRRKAKPWGIAICAFSPLLLIAGQSYGGEASMRVFLYSLAGCTVLIAALLVHALTGRRAAGRWVGRSAAWLLLVTFALAGMHGYYSSWSFITITRTQLEQSRELLATNRDRPAITVWASQAGWPERPSGDYVKFALADSIYDVPLDELRHSTLKDIPDGGDMVELEAGPNATGAPLFLVLTRQLYAYDEWVGLFKPGVLDGLEHELKTRPGWTEEFNDADTVVYRYSPEWRSR
jgi:hypothetical protein